MVLYDEKMLSVYSERIKKGTLLCALSLVAALLVCVGMCFLLDEDKNNATLILVVNVIINTLVGWFSLSVLLCYTLPNVKRRRVTKTVLSTAKKQICGTVTAMDKCFTSQEGVKVVEIQMDCDGINVSVFYDTLLDEPKFHVGDRLRVTVARNFVFAYERDYEKEI